MAGNKILIVDDSITYLQFAATSLQTAGYDVVTSNSAWISGIVIKERPDLILMDVQLGSVSGVAAVSVLRKRSFARDTCILLHSSGAHDKLAELARSCGASGCLVKDGRAESLIRSVKQALASTQKTAAQ